jgi:hypothetical protein
VARIIPRILLHVKICQLQAGIFTKLLPIGPASADEKTRDQAFPGGSNYKQAKLMAYTEIFAVLICYFYMVDLVSVSELST